VLSAGLCNLLTIPTSYVNVGVDADLVSFIHGNSYPTENFDVRAGACQLDSGYRNQPIAASFEFNTARYGTNYDFEDHLAVTLHEMTNALAFSGTLYGLYTKDDGSAYLPTERTATATKRDNSVTMITFPKVVAKARRA